MTSVSKKLVVMLYLSVTIPTIAYASAQTDAFAVGQALANGAQASTAAGVTNGAVANTVNSFNPTYYQYSTNAPQTNLYQGGNGDTISAGAGKITTCQTGALNPDPFLQQNCNAINFMAKNPSTRPQFSISPTDPNIALSKAILANAPTLAANSLGYANPAAVGTSFSGCTNTTVTTPATYTTEVCNDFNSIASQTCTMGQIVVVNANTNYQCNKTQNTYKVQTCNRTLNVVVTPAQFCSVSGGGTGVGAYFDMVFGCSGDALAVVTVGITGAVQCHGGSCNSDYYPITLNFVPGHDAGPVTTYVSRTYDGIWWNLTTVSYSGVTNTVTASVAVSAGRGGVIKHTATMVPTGTVGIQNVITTSWIDGCAVQEAAAL